MEFRCRNEYEPPPPPQYREQKPWPPPPHSVYCYRKPGYGLSNDYFGQRIGHTNEYFRQGTGWANEYFHIPSNVHEEIQRSLEKERIRDEIIAAEIARRMVLEAEVRAEIRMERELALRAIRGDTFSRFSFPLGAGMALEPRGVTFQQEAKGLEDRIAMYVEERLRMGTRCETQGFDMLPFQQRSVDIKGVTPSHLENSKQKEKIVFLAKPSASLSVAKRKVVSPAEDCGNREGKEEWSCVICQVTATNERTLKDHFQGKKHRSKEAALRAKRNGCNIGIGVLPKNAVKPKIVTHLSSPQVGGEEPQIDQSVLSSLQVQGEVLQVNQNVLRSPQGLKLGVETQQINQNEPSSLHIVSTKSLDENSVSVLQENEEKDKLKKRKLVGVKGAPKSKLKEKKNFTFWCEMCQVGTYCEIVMEGHRKGKKHLKLLEKAGKNGQAILTSGIVDIEGANGADETTKGDKKNL